MIEHPTPEQAVIGAAIAGAEGHQPFLELTDADFQSNADRIVATVLRDMIRNRRPIDSGTVVAELAARGQASRLPEGSVYVHSLYAVAPPPFMSASYAHMVRAATRVRLHAELTARMAAKFAMEQADENLDELLHWRRTQEEAIPDALDADDSEADLLATLLAEADEPADWVVPGLLERGDRVVLTGHEGHGKSVVLRQLVACIAAGVHPWTGRRFGEGLRVMQVDVENSRPQTKHGYWMVQRIMNHLPKGWARNVTIKIRNDGLDLLGRDAGWLHRIASQCSPDVIVAGPAYKMMRTGETKDDRDVLRLLSVLDEVRVRHNCALVLEHHAPHGDGFGRRTVRPFGSSVWLRWPEVGIGLAEHVEEATGEKPNRDNDDHPDWLDVVRWRPPREDRDWPKEIRWGAVGELPWVPWGGYEPRVANRLAVA